MSWKRRLLCFYIFAWAAAATFGAFIARDQSHGALEHRYVVHRFLSDHEISFAELQSLPLDSLVRRAKRAAATLPSVDQHDVVLWTPYNLITVPQIALLRGLAAQHSNMHPTPALVRIWAKWAASYMLFPAVLLLALRWSASHLQSNDGHKRT